jgi:Raf kinase inhibitor-like YbhB/YbcL family protein
MNLKIDSDEFANEQVIPVRYTCDGQDISPPLRWGQAPEGTKSFALLVEDPDAPSGTFDHWILFNIPPVTTELSEGIPNLPVLDYGMKQGVNGFKRIGYGGPCPPSTTLSKSLKSWIVKINDTQSHQFENSFIS